MLTSNERFQRAAVALSVAICSGLAACSPYPDQGEFLAGVVFSGSFLAGVRGLNTLQAVGKGRDNTPFPPYAVLGSGGNSATSVTTAAPATSPLWTDGKRDPLSVASAQPVYVFDNAKACQPQADAEPYDPFWTLVDATKQYPIFTDLPEVLTANAGKAGRTGTYSAVVEIVHLPTPAGYTCQSLKRGDSVQKRLEGDLKPAGGAKEYRLLLIVDAALTVPPLPYQLGWFNQLIVPYIDMGPVPLDMTGQRFATMPVVDVVEDGAMEATWTVVAGAADEQGAGAPVYSPICRPAELDLDAGDAVPPPDLGDPAFAGFLADKPFDPKAIPGWFACLVCRATKEDASGYVCPFAQTGGGAK